MAIVTWSDVQTRVGTPQNVQWSSLFRTLYWNFPVFYYDGIPKQFAQSKWQKANYTKQSVQSKLHKRNWTIQISQIKFHKANCKNQSANQIAKKEITLTTKIIPNHSSYYVGSKTSLCRLCKPSLHYTFFSPSLVNTSEAILVPTHKIFMKKNVFQFFSSNFFWPIKRVFKLWRKICLYQKPWGK